jgi:hypothetical protein
MSHRLRHARAVAILSAFACIGACSRSGVEPPTKLVDGSTVRESPVRLESVGKPVVWTTVAVRDLPWLRRGSLAEQCVRGPFRYREVAGPVVTRIGVNTVSVTAADGSGSGLVGCIDSPGARDESRRWCGTVYGRWTDGRLADPRLDLICVTRDGEPIASAWVNAGADARYVVVAQDGYAESYEVAAGLPVRIVSTRNVDRSRARATFEVTEHDADGRLLRRYRLETLVAG